MCAAPVTAECESNQRPLWSAGPGMFRGTILMEVHKHTKNPFKSEGKGRKGERCMYAS